MKSRAGIVVVKAITLWRPWPWAIFHAGKDIENRSWKPPQALIGHRLVIHAGKKFDEGAVDYIRRLGFDCPEDEAKHPQGIIGTVRFTGTVESVEPGLPQGMMFSRWFEGPVGWMIADPKKLEAPLAVAGKQSLWNLPAEFARAVLEG